MRIRPNGSRSIGGVFATVAIYVLSNCQPDFAGLVFPPAERSPYVLPYPVGEASGASQSYGNPCDGHRNRVTIDFKMPMGASITASRGGEFIAVVEQFLDGDLTRGHNNRVLIQHEDGTIAWYADLRQDSVIVDGGGQVVAGQSIAQCGNNGNLRHLQFEVFHRRVVDHDDAVPVSFRYARGSLDERGGLVAGIASRALGERP